MIAVTKGFNGSLADYISAALKNPKNPDLDPRLMGHAGSITPFAIFDSASRLQMAVTQFGQAVVLHKGEANKLQSGYEREFGKYTFNVKVPEDCKVVMTLDKYGDRIGVSSIGNYTTSFIIYESLDRQHEGEYGVIEVGTHMSNHPTFGFKLERVKGKERNDISPGMFLYKDEVISKSPSVADNGDYKYGLNVNTAFMSIPGVTEDGFVISESLLNKLKVSGVDSRIAQWGKTKIPLNLYGSDDEYKPFPGIGDKVRDDGLVFALREFDEEVAPFELTPKALRTPIFTTDQCMFGAPGALVYDVNVNSGIGSKHEVTRPDHAFMAKRYYDATKVFYERLLRWEMTTRRDKEKQGLTLRLSPKLTNMIKDGFSYKVKPIPTENLQKSYRRAPLDEYRVEVKYSYTINGTDGYKLTDSHGSKGVVVSVWPSSDMPTDQHGNRADIIIEGESGVKRMNPGQFYEHTINSWTDQTERKIKELVSKGKEKEAWEYFFSYCTVASPMFGKAIEESITLGKTTPGKVIQNVVEHGMRLWLPIDSSTIGPEQILSLNKYFPLEMGPVTYRAPSGKMVKTKDPVIIGSKYFMLLEKRGDKWAAVSSPRLQHFGLPAAITDADKYSSPVREKATRIFGEDEVRILLAVLGGYNTADLLDISTSPSSARAVYSSLLDAPEPSNVDCLVDREKNPVGLGRPTMLVKSILRCSGTEYIRHDYEEIKHVEHP